MTFYADVIVDISVRELDRVFQYRVPEGILSAIVPGSRVIVPFGHREVYGTVTGISSEPSIESDRIKDIISISDNTPAATRHLISLAMWMSKRYGVTLNQCLSTVMPVKRIVKEKKAVIYKLTDRGKAELLYDRIKDSRREKARARLLRALLHGAGEGISLQSLKGVLGIGKATVDYLKKEGIICEENKTITRGADRGLSGKWGVVKLSEEQSRVFEEIYSAYRMLGDVRNADPESRAESLSSKDYVHLLHGITGSGKTEVYMELISRVVDEGRQAIVLIPEISLTPQTVSRFYERFGDRIAVMNSRLSAGERYDQYMRAKNGDADIMIGPRSAIFTPFNDLGLIVIDEEHEGSYKSESSPRYHVRDLAMQRARMSGALLLLGSATPSLSTYYNAVEGRFSLHELKSRAKKGSSLPEVEIVDLREEFNNKNMSILSRRLKDAIHGALVRGEQTMLFINRRGFAGFVSCRSCGYVFKCEHCDVSMTIHGKDDLRCHYCGSSKKLPRLCPSCSSPHIAGFGLGTEKVESIVKKEFPSARVLRMDRDTTSGKEDAGKILQDFSDGRADILIGTQMIVKGHDFDRVSLMGVIAAELSMFSGDYMSSERTFQLLTQAAGRAGRGELPGLVIVQSYRPDDYCIKTAASQDYISFYNKEIEYRKAMNYPPASHMLMMGIEGKDEKAAADAAERIAGFLARYECLSILGPAAAGIAKIRDMYRFAIYVKDRDEERLISVREELGEFLRENAREFKEIYISTDLDPYNLF